MTDATAAPIPSPAVAYVPPTRNKLGIAALIIVLAATILLPIIVSLVGFFGTLTSPQQTPDTPGWAVLGGFVSFLFGFALAGPVVAVGVVLAIVALTRKNKGKVAAIIALVIGIPVAIAGCLLLIPTWDMLF